MSIKNYLFLDIECCNGNHICSIGYVICDEKFTVIDKKDIIINPEREFKLARAGFDPRVKLAYKPEYFKTQPNFKQVYNEVNKIFRFPTTVLIKSRH